MDILVVEPGMEPYAKEIYTEQEMRAIVGGPCKRSIPLRKWWPLCPTKKTMR